MKEISAIINAFDEAAALGKMTALATVVKVEGSSYRRAGARMLITEDGLLTGAISGGCLEGDALRKARLAMSQGHAMLVTYDTMDEDDAKLGVGLGCNGIIQILIEPIIADHLANPIMLLRSFLSKRESAVLVTTFNIENKQALQYGTCMLIGKDGSIIGGMNDEGLALEVLADALKMLAKGNREDKHYIYNDGYLCFIELMEPAVSLVIAGAGNDALPLIQIAAVLGWRVILADGRPNYVNRERFPMVDRRIVSRPEELLRQLPLDQRTVFVLMTHNYNYDMVLLEGLLLLDLSYVGVLGPKKRLNRMLDEITGKNPSIPIRDRLFGPAGLDLGSDNPDEIALSIIAEIQSVLSNRTARPLKEKAVIHERKQVTRVLLENKHP